MSKAWEEDCIMIYGKVLTGKFAHWCPEWDFLPIDETCEEFEVCLCYRTPTPATETSANPENKKV